MKSRILFIVVSTFLVSSQSHAGLQLSPFVVVQDNFIGGSLGATRHSINLFERIGCHDFGSSIYCIATNSVNTTRTCVSLHPPHINSVRGINEDAVISVVINSDGTCQSIAVEHSSKYPPKR